MAVDERVPSGTVALAQEFHHWVGVRRMLCWSMQEWACVLRWVGQEEFEVVVCWSLFILAATNIWSNNYIVCFPMLKNTWDNCGKRMPMDFHNCQHGHTDPNYTHCNMFYFLNKHAVLFFWGGPEGYAPGTPFKMSCSPTTGAVPPYSSSPNPYPAAVYPVRSTYPQQNPYAQVRVSQSHLQLDW